MRLHFFAFRDLIPFSGKLSCIFRSRSSFKRRQIEWWVISTFESNLKDVIGLFIFNRIDLSHIIRVRVHGAWARKCLWNAFPNFARARFESASRSRRAWYFGGFMWSSLRSVEVRVIQNSKWMSSSVGAKIQLKSQEPVKWDPFWTFCKRKSCLQRCCKRLLNSIFALQKYFGPSKMLMKFFQKKVQIFLEFY